MNYYIVKSYPDSLMVQAKVYDLYFAVELCACRVEAQAGRALFNESVTYVIETEDELPIDPPGNILYGNMSEVFAGVARGMEEVARRAREEQYR